MKIETEYNIGDEVWVAISETKQEKCKVHRIRIDIVNDKKNIRYDIISENWTFPITMPSAALFPTKEELLNSL